MDSKDELLRRGIKMIDVSLTSVYFLFGALIISGLTNRIFGTFDQQKYVTMSIYEVVANVVLHSAAVVLSAYLLRNLIEMIPFPFDGTRGYVHGRIKELDGGIILLLVFVATQDALIEKIKYLYKRLIQS